MFLNLSERHCVINRDSLLPRHCNPIRDRWKFTCMFFKGRAGRRRTESRPLHLAPENSWPLSARECKTSSALNQQ